jgi:hypothetical protein
METQSDRELVLAFFTLDMPLLNDRQKPCVAFDRETKPLIIGLTMANKKR